MYKGFILSESLKNPLVLNDLKQIYVKVEDHSENKELPIWHDFKVTAEANEIANVCKIISKQIKEAWYAHFWNENTVYVILSNKVFKIPREKEWQSKEYNECKIYAMAHGVDERYLDFWLED